MIRKSVIAALAGVAMLSATPVLAQGIGHSFFMKGSIVANDSNGTVVCIGKADGAEVGQTLTVYRVKTASGGKGAQAFRRDRVGQVKIDHIYDDHFAHVSVVDGKPAKHDIVELRRP